MPDEPLRPRVLIVEDNAANLQLVAAVLGRAGVTTRGARTVEEARARLRESLPDLILVDVQLPGVDGLTFTRELRADPRTGAIPIVAVTARAMPGDREQALAAGCVGYVAKPINTRTFAGEVLAMVAPGKGHNGAGGQ